MISFGEWALLNPYVLLGLLLLPIIWRLLRLTAPKPKKLTFPAIRLLFGLQSEQLTSEKAPWWLILLRLTIAALLIVSVSRLLLNPSEALQGDGPVILVVDNGWASAHDWTLRRTAALDLIDRANRRHRPVVLITTAPEPVGAEEVQVPDPRGPLPPHVARDAVSGLVPYPWATEPDALLSRLQDAEWQNAQIVWIGDGLFRPGRDDLVAELEQFGDLIYQTPLQGEPKLLLLPPERAGTKITARLHRLSNGLDQPIQVVARGNRGEFLGLAEATFPAEEMDLTVELTLPVEQANQLQSLSVVNHSSAASVVMLGSGWSRHAVGLVTPPGSDSTEFLSHPNYFLLRGLRPFAELEQAPLRQLLEADKAVIVINGTLPNNLGLREQLDEWVRKGGLLIRFAEEGRLPSDRLMPVRLRQGDRAFGGALSWERPQRLAPFPETSPFVGLPIPREVTVSRQVLAEPSPELAARTWAVLEDGTPLVTGEMFDKGRVVLFHVTANDRWSDLPLSGLFLQMMQRVLRLAESSELDGNTVSSSPAYTLDGYGGLGQAAPDALPLPVGETKVGPRHPPGLYGFAGNYQPHNLAPALLDEEVRLSVPRTVPVVGLSEQSEMELGPWLLAAAMCLLIIDGLATLHLRGYLVSRHRFGAVFLGLGVLAASASTAMAQSIPPAALQTRLGYVVTGDDRMDRLSAAGLGALSQVVTERTSVELASPDGVRLERDTLAFYPLLYWPLSDGQTIQGDFAMQRLRTYLDKGGTLLIDSRDRQVEPARFRRLLSGLDVPPLIRLPDDHVLTRAFYLLRGLPGRYPDAPIWIEHAGEHDHDGVSPLIIGGNDWAGAWARDSQGRPLLQPVPGGERQRELAFRFGINLVMYALTGNYKNDQVHLPAILERLAP